MSLPTAATGSPRRRPAWHLAVYFGLAYGVTWGAIVFYLTTLSFDLAALGTAEFMVMLALMLAGPSVAGLALTIGLEGRRGLNDLWDRLTRFRVDLRWYAFALLPVPTLLLAVLLALSATVSTDYLPSFVAFGIVAGLLAGSLEEVGWTGFATPRLLERLSPLAAGLVLGLLWAAWHGLADFAGNAAMMGTGEWVIRFFVYWLVPLTCYRVLMTWAYAQHRSLGLGMLMHAGYTGWLATLTMSMPAATGSRALLWQALFALGIVAFTAAIVTRSGVTMRRSAPAPGSAV